MALEGIGLVVSFVPGQTGSEEVGFGCLVLVGQEWRQPKGAEGQPGGQGEREC